MRVIGIVSSARRRGNCYDLAEAVLSYLQDRGIETELFNTVDNEINPCNRCRYECFVEEDCPIDDDVPLIWGKMKEADGIVLCVPSYYGLPPAVFKAIIERAQGILDRVTQEFRDLDGVWRGKPVVIMVVADGGGKAILEYLEELLSSADTISEQISYVRLGIPGYEGGLIKIPKVAMRVEKIAEEMYLKLAA